MDGMSIDAAKDYLREQWPNIRSQLLGGTYQPMPVKRVEIPKPDGGVRKLGVPCVVDRLIQQSLLQVLQKRWDPTFSEHSYGFRPGRSAHQAVAQAQRYIAEGYAIVVDLDLEKFFDRVNHDMLMARVAVRVSDKRVLKLIRAFLNAGVMEDGLVRPVDEGTPQGGPLSPLLSNLVLDDLDKELSRRGHRFCRYADDCNIYVCSRRAGERVMASVTRFLTRKAKAEGQRGEKRGGATGGAQVPGFYHHERWGRAAHRAQGSRQVQDENPGYDRPDPRTKPGADCRRPRPVSYRLARILRLLPDAACAHEPGSMDTPETTLVSRRQWRNGHNRFKELRRRGVSKFHAAVAAGSPTGFWRMSSHPAVQQPCATMLSMISDSPGFMLPQALNPVEPPWYGPVCPVVWEGRRREASPYPDLRPDAEEQALAHAKAERSRWTLDATVATLAIRRKNYPVQLLLRQFNNSKPSQQPSRKPSHLRTTLKGVFRATSRYLGRERSSFFLTPRRAISLPNIV